MDISFETKNGSFSWTDLPDEKAENFLQDSNKAFDFSVKDSLKFTHCKCAALSSDGSLSLDSCAVKKVTSKGHIILKNCSKIASVKADGILLLLGCRNIKTIEAEAIYTDTELNAKITGVVNSITLDKKKLEHTFMKKDATVLTDLKLSPYTKIHVQEGVVKGNIIFPEDSIFSESERVVFLINGGTLDGEVINGYLVDLNNVENEDIGL